MNIGTNLGMWIPIIQTLVCAILGIQTVRAAIKKELWTAIVFAFLTAILATAAFVGFGSGIDQGIDQEAGSKIQNEVNYGKEKPVEVLKKEAKDKKPEELKAQDRDSSKEKKEADDYIKQALKEAKK